MDESFVSAGIDIEPEGSLVVGAFIRCNDAAGVRTGWRRDVGGISQAS